MSRAELASKLAISSRRVDDISEGKRRVDPETAWLFAQAFGTSPEFWMNLQSRYDLSLSRPHRKIPRLTPVV